MGNENGTALARVEEQAAAVSPFDGNPEAFNTGVKIAKGLAESNLIPGDYQKKPANVMVAMEYANRLGASVLAVMQNLDVIHGRPSLRASFLIGTVNASGRFSPIRYRWQGEEGTDTWGCRAVAIDRESGEECVGPLVTIALAKAEGWYNKRGSKWQTIPELMLMYRAGSWWTRVYAPDLSLGLHTVDEVEDMGPPPQQRRQELAAVLDAGDESDTPERDWETVEREVQEKAQARSLTDLADEATVTKRPADES